MSGGTKSSHANFVERVFNGGASRRDAREYADAHSLKGYVRNIVTNFASSTPPTDRNRPSAETIAAAARRCAGDKSYAAVVNRLTCFFDPRRSKCGCPYCVANDVCMAIGCARHPIGTATALHSATFRCTPGLHLCGKHGLGVNVNRRTCSTNHTLVLKDNRTRRNVWLEETSHVSRKCSPALEDTRASCRKRLLAVNRLKVYGKRMRLEEVPAGEAIAQVLACLCKLDRDRA